MRISVIKYNILNLPDTIQFINGNQIVNLYDVSGHKYKSIAYTVIPTTVTAHYEVEHYTFGTDTVEYLVTEYAGNIETIYTPRDTTRRIFNSIGYWADNAYYYFIKDHLGNICAVVNANTDTVVQRTMYYASGVPMAQSWGRDTQPYLYNGKEFIESHGWNTYDYGFRGYYAPTGRFTSIDPLAEQTPWQSPYAYAGNNFINNIDWMGLGGMNFTTPHYIVVDLGGNVIGGVDDDDHNIYIDLDGEWDEDEGKDGLIWVCGMEYEHAWYFSGGGGGRSNVVTSGQIKTAIGRSLIADVALGIADSYLRNVTGEKMGNVGKKITDIIDIGETALNIYQIFDSYLQQGYSPQIAYDATKTVITGVIDYLLKKGGGKVLDGMLSAAPKITSIAVSAAPYVLTAAGISLIGWSYYKAGEYFANMVNDLNGMFNSKNFWGNLYGFDRYEQSW